jgi:hypothetical protein
MNKPCETKVLNVEAASGQSIIVSSLRASLKLYLVVSSEKWPLRTSPICGIECKFPERATEVFHAKRSQVLGG